MSRLLVAVFLLLGGALPITAPTSPATAAERSSTTAEHPSVMCTVRDARLNEISGMAVTRNGYVVIDDSSDDPSHRKVFFLTNACRVSRTLSYPSRPRDTEDMATAPDGTIWVADIGDNDRSRKTIGLWKLAPGASAPKLYRLSYPDGPHDAEALLLSGDGTPIVVTKDPGTADIYTPATSLRAGATVALRQVGQFTIPNTTTRNPFSVFGRALITGAAASPDGRRVVLRTYADAFEFDVTDGNVVAALTTGKPRAIALPDEPQGESIAYSTDGTTLLTVSESAGQPAGSHPTILRYPLPAASVVHAAPPPSAGASAAGPSAAGPALAATGPGPRRRLADMTYSAAGAAAVGLLLAGIGFLGFYRSRRTNR